MPMIEKIVHTAKQTVKATVESPSAHRLPEDTVSAGSFCWMFIAGKSPGAARCIGYRRAVGTRESWTYPVRETP
jgi:hypothetical protein